MLHLMEILHKTKMLEIFRQHPWREKLSKQINDLLSDNITETYYLVFYP